MDRIGRTCPGPSDLPPRASHGTLERSLVVLGDHHVKGEAILMLGAAGLGGGKEPSSTYPVLIEGVLLAH
jgi:hypothetical protein